ncbi:MAG: diacylglycerol kinase family protein [Anaerolineales bacterium]
MGKKIKFIVNPIAGRGAGVLALPEIDRLANGLAMEYEIVSTEHPGHAIDLAKQAAMADMDVVVAVGGDGTSNEVLNGLMQAWTQGYKSTYMAILAIGRGNDFAYAFGIPPGIQAGFSILQRRIPRWIDVGNIEGGDYPQGRYFGNGVGIGFDAVVGFEATKLTHLHGFLNYIVAALKTIFLYFNAPTIQIEYDGETIIQSSLMVSIMNGRRMGGGFMMAPDAQVDDGQLDICIAGQLSRFGILTMIPRFMKGTQASQPQIKIFRAKKVHLTAIEGSLPAHADGETICIAGHELIVENIKQPIQILHG